VRSCFTRPQRGEADPLLQPRALQYNDMPDHQHQGGPRDKKASVLENSITSPSAWSTLAEAGSQDPKVKALHRRTDSPSWHYTPTEQSTLVNRRQDTQQSAGGPASHGAGGHARKENAGGNTYSLQRWLDEKPKEQPWVAKQESNK